MSILQLLWPVPALAASVACLLILRWIFRRSGEWKRPRAWLLAALVVGAALLCGRVSWRASPGGVRETLELRTGLPLPFWPRDSYSHDNDAGMVVAHLRLSPAELAKLPRGTSVPRKDAASWLAWQENMPERDKRVIAADAELEQYTRCVLGWYSMVLLDRKSGQLWATLFYAESQENLPCIPG